VTMAATPLENLLEPPLPNVEAGLLDDDPDTGTAQREAMTGTDADEVPQGFQDAFAASGHEQQRW